MGGRQPDQGETAGTGQPTTERGQPAAGTGQPRPGTEQTDSEGMARQPVVVGAAVMLLFVVGAFLALPRSQLQVAVGVLGPFFGGAGAAYLAGRSMTGDLKHAAAAVFAGVVAFFVALPVYVLLTESGPASGFFAVGMIFAALTFGPPAAFVSLVIGGVGGVAASGLRDYLRE